MSNIHYQIHQNGQDIPWILLIHGLFGSLDNLAALRRGLTDEYNVLSIDLPDHGNSLRTTEFSFENYALLIGQLVNELDISNLNVVGHSLGGKIAMQLALSQAELIHRLIVLDIAPVSYSPRHQTVLTGLEHVPLNLINSRQNADQYLQEFVKEPSTRQFLLKSLYQDDTGWHWYFNLALLKRDYAQLSAGIDTKTQFLKPTLFIKGELSDYLTTEHKAEVMQLFPNSQLKVLANTGHWLHAEKPALCIKMIKSFLA
ncbi:alpha/beta fold hydrolase [Paraglaciecola sp.]|uniref:alpha/beta fold hydrolase n=1 Tax=Paraglaciecola sp. TaxID=1920173 RepID=UPI0030F3CCB6